MKEKDVITPSRTLTWSPTICMTQGHVVSYHMHDSKVLVLKASCDGTNDCTRPCSALVKIYSWETWSSKVPQSYNTNAKIDLNFYEPGPQTQLLWAWHADGTNPRRKSTDTQLRWALLNTRSSAVSSHRILSEVSCTLRVWRKSVRNAFVACRSRQLALGHN